MSNRKLLLADDSITIQKVVNLTFAEEGIDVITVGDGDSALARISEEWPDLVLADVNMPGANGYQICESIRSNKATEDIPVVLLVGSFEPFDPAEANRVGANAYLTKPFHSIRQLVAQVTELIETRRQVVQEVDADPAEEIESVSAEQAVPDDIETLYDQSMTPQAELPGEIGSFDISDQGLDDEMIETSYSKDADTLEFSVVEPSVQPPTSEINTEEFSPFEVETPYSQPEPHMVDRENLNAHSLATNETDSDGSADSSVESGDPVHEPEKSIQNPEAAPVRNITAEPEVVQEMHTHPIPLGPGSGPEQPPAVWQDEVNEPHYAAPQVLEPDEQPAASWQSQSETLNLPYEQKIAASVSTRVFEEIDLLELPPVGEDTELEVTTPDHAFEQGSDKQVVSLSPEIIDMIVQKVIDRMSERS